MQTFAKKLSKKESDIIAACILCDTKEHLIIRKYDYDKNYQVQCESCLCAGPVESKRKDAIESWNMVM